MARKYSTLIFSLALTLGTLAPFVLLGVTYFHAYLFAVLTVSLFALLSRNISKNSLVYLTIFSIFLGVSIGVFRGVHINSSNHTTIQEHIDSNVSFTGSVVDYPDEREGYTYLTIGDVVIGNKVISEKILVKAPLYPKYHYKDVVRVQGKLVTPSSSIENEDGSASRFSYKNYLSKDNIYSIVYYPTITFVEKENRNLLSYLYTVKDTCIYVVTSLIPEPMAGLLLGILFGIKRALGSDMLMLFSTAGLVHLVVLSGYNVSLVIEGVTKFISSVKELYRFFIVICSLAVFTLFVGASPSVIRAVGMASIALFARMYGREAHALSLLAIVLAGITFYNPKNTLYDPGMALSFLATIGLITFTPYIYSKVAYVPKRFFIREIFASSIAVMITTTPYLLWYMGKVSIVGIITNLIVVPVMPIIMIVGFICTILGMIYLPLGIPVAVVLSGVLYYVILVAEFFGGLRFSSIVVSISTLSMISVYLVIIYFGLMISSGRLNNSG